MNATSPASRPYRSKTVKPCDACRRRRTACIRNEGERDCSLCRHRQTNCTFVTTPKRRKAAKRRGNGQHHDLIEQRSFEAPLRDLDNTSHADGLDGLDLTTGFPAPDLTLPPIQIDDIDLSFLSRIDPRYLITEKHTSSNVEEWFNGSTSIHDRTCLYSGASSDQGSFLLRHLGYNSLGCFGDDRCLAWRVDAQQEPTFLTIYPNHHLDCHAAMFDVDMVDQLYAPFQDELVKLYFTYVHPSYPVLGSRAWFDKQRSHGSMPASLLAMVYLHGAFFWHMSSQKDVPLSDQRSLSQYVYQCLTFEARTPSLAIVQATLLFMQLPARFNRAPNHPGVWACTAMVLSMAQEIGLHVDPSNWSINSEEKRLRRILWWAVFLHEKIMAHWLGRPSHTKMNDWNVEPLNLKDFADDDGRVDVDCISWANAFIAVANISLVLSDLLERFYGIRSNFQALGDEVALQEAKVVMQKLKSWKENHRRGLNLESRPYHYVVHILAITVELSTLRALLGSKKGIDDTCQNLLNDVLRIVTQSLFPILDSLIHLPTTGLWLNYTKGSLSLVGSLLISLVLSSTSDTELEQRRAILFDFRSRLQQLVNEHAASQCFEFSRFPLRRVNLILEELFGKYNSNFRAAQGEPSTSTSPVTTDADERLWASYRIAFP